MKVSSLLPLPKKNIILLMKTMFVLYIPVYMRELNIHFTIYTKDMQTKSVKNPLYFINKICFLSSSFGTKSS